MCTHVSLCLGTLFAGDFGYFFSFWSQPCYWSFLLALDCKQLLFNCTSLHSQHTCDACWAFICTGVTRLTCAGLKPPPFLWTLPLCTRFLWHHHSSLTFEPLGSFLHLPGTDFTFSIYSCPWASPAMHISRMKIHRSPYSWSHPAAVLQIPLLPALLWWVQTQKGDTDFFLCHATSHAVCQVLPG